MVTALKISAYISETFPLMIYNSRAASGSVIFTLSFNPTLGNFPAITWPPLCPVLTLLPLDTHIVE